MAATQSASSVVIGTFFSDEVSDSILDFDDNVSFCDQFTLSSFRPVTSSDISQLIGRSTSCPLDPVPASKSVVVCCLKY